jgi:LuxR family transcriptional regulator, maltose regulon positive regulatory protein
MAKRSQDPRLTIPPVPPRYVPRPRLVSALDLTTAAVPLTLVSAGPGAGKTVLLSAWARAQTRRVAWLSLGRPDDDPRRFWRLFLSALRGAQIAAVTPPIGLTTGTAELLDSVYGDMPESDVSPVLILDDAHVLEHRDVLDGLDSIVRMWRDRLRLVVAARSDPLLPLARYRLDGAMRELRAAELAMTLDEARSLFSAHDVSLADDEFDVLLRRTEGWTAGLRLSALRMEGHAHSSAFVTDLALDEGSVGEYLIDEVLTVQPRQVRKLLIETSFLPEVNGSLARHVTGIEDAPNILDSLARTNSFVAPIDRERTRFRYHHLFQEILRYLFQRRSAGSAHALLSRAGQWFEAQGDLLEALRWYVRADDAPAVIRMLVHGGYAGIHVAGGSIRPTGLGQLLSAHRGDEGGDGSGINRDELATLALISDAVRDDPPRGIERLRQLGSDLSRTGATEDLVFTAALAELRTARRAGEWVRLHDLATGLIEHHPAVVGRTPGLQASLLLSAATALFWQGDLAAVPDVLRRARELAERDGIDQLRVDILGLSALHDVSMARPRHAARTRASVMELLDASAGITTPVTLEISDAQAAYMTADFDSMSRSVRNLVAIGSPEPDLTLDSAIALAHASLLVACGRVSEARALMDGAPALVACTTGLIRMQRDLILAEIEMTLGRPHSALAALQPYVRTSLGEHVATMRAAAYLALGDVKSARDCVRLVLTTTNPSIARGCVVSALLCEARIDLLAGDESRGVELLVRATEIGDGDIVLPFARQADVFGEALLRHPTLAARWPVPPQSDFAAVRRAVPLGSELPDPLTERERGVLRYLATSMSTAEIAAELYLSVNTIKTHLAAIYRKLAAGRRREAVLRARELELL